MQSVTDRLRESGALGRVMKSADRTLVAVGNGVRIEPDVFNEDPCVELVVPIVPPQANRLQASGAAPVACSP